MNAKKSRTSVRKEREDNLSERVPGEMLEKSPRPMPTWMTTPNPVAAGLLPARPPFEKR